MTYPSISQLWTFHSVCAFRSKTLRTLCRCETKDPWQNIRNKPRTWKFFITMSLKDAMFQHGALIFFPRKQQPKTRAVRETRTHALLQISRDLWVYCAKLCGEFHASRNKRSRKVLHTGFNYRKLSKKKSKFSVTLCAKRVRVHLASYWRPRDFRVWGSASISLLSDA